MAEVSATNNQVFDSFTRRVVWTPLANGDTGEPVTLHLHSDKTVQVTGTPSVGGTLVIEGSLEETPTNWFPLTDQNGNAISFTSIEGAIIVENVSWIRPRVSAGDGSTAFTVTMIGRRTV